MFLLFLFLLLLLLFIILILLPLLLLMMRLDSDHTQGPTLQPPQGSLLPVAVRVLVVVVVQVERTNTVRQPRLSHPLTPPLALPATPHPLPLLCSPLPPPLTLRAAQTPIHYLPHTLLSRSSLLMPLTALSLAVAVVQATESPLHSLSPQLTTLPLPSSLKATATPPLATRSLPHTPHTLSSLPLATLLLIPPHTLPLPTTSLMLLSPTTRIPPTPCTLLPFTLTFPLVVAVVEHLLMEASCSIPPSLLTDSMEEGEEGRGATTLPRGCIRLPLPTLLHSLILSTPTTTHRAPTPTPPLVLAFIPVPNRPEPIPMVLLLTSLWTPLPPLSSLPRAAALQRRALPPPHCVQRVMRRMERVWVIEMEEVEEQEEERDPTPHNLLLALLSSVTLFP
jgi:hypothetical protein